MDPLFSAWWSFGALAGLALVRRSTGSRTTGRRPGEDLRDGTQIVLAPPPKVIIRPKGTLGTIVIAWSAGGMEIQPATSGGSGVAIVAPVKTFAMEVSSGSGLASFPIRAATLYVRSIPNNSVRCIQLELDAQGKLKWFLDGQSVQPLRLEPQGQGKPPKITLPQEFFGEYLGTITETKEGELSPAIAIEW